MPVVVVVVVNASCCPVQPHCVRSDVAQRRWARDQEHPWQHKHGAGGWIILLLNLFKYNHMFGSVGCICSMEIWWQSWLTKLSMGSTTYLNSNDSILSLSTEMRSIIRSIVRDLDPTNELTFLRVKSIKHEVRFWNSEPWCVLWRQTVFLKRRLKSFFQVMVA